MSGAEWSLQDAKNSFSAVVAAAAEGTPQIVTKRGNPRSSSCQWRIRKNSRERLRRIGLPLWSICSPRPRVP